MTDPAVSSAADRLRSEYARMLTGPYRTLPMEQVYGVFADLSSALMTAPAGEPRVAELRRRVVPRAGAAPLAMLRSDMAQLLIDSFAMVGPVELNQVFGALAQQVELMRRSSGAFEAARSGSGAQQSVRVSRTGATSVVVSGARPAVVSGGAPAVPSHGIRISGASSPVSARHSPPPIPVVPSPAPGTSPSEGSTSRAGSGTHPASRPAAASETAPSQTQSERPPESAPSTPAAPHAGGSGSHAPHPPPPVDPAGAGRSAPRPAGAEHTSVADDGSDLFEPAQVDQTGLRVVIRRGEADGDSLPAGVQEVLWLPLAHRLRLTPVPDGGLSRIAHKLLDPAGVIFLLDHAPALNERIEIQIDAGGDFLPVNGKVSVVRERRVAIQVAGMSDSVRDRLTAAAALHRTGSVPTSQSSSVPKVTTGAQPILGVRSLTGSHREGSSSGARAVASGQSASAGSGAYGGAASPSPNLSGAIPLPSLSGAFSGVAETLHEEHGEIGDVGVEGVLLRTASQFPALELEFTSASARWTVHIKNASVVEISTASPDVRFDLPALLEKSGFIAKETIAEAQQLAAQQGRSLARILFDAGATEPQKLLAILQARLKLALNALFETTFTSYSLVARDRLIIDSINPPIRITELAFGRIRQRCEAMPIPDVEKLVMARAEGYPMFRRVAQVPVERLALDAKQKRLIDELLTGELSLMQVIQRSPMRRYGTSTIVLAFDRAGLIDWRSKETAAARSERMRSALLAKQAEIAKANPFEILLAHWSSYTEAVMDAHRKITADLDLPFLCEHAPDDIRRLANGVREAIDRSRDELATREQREAVRARLIDGFGRRAVIELCLQRAKLALFKNDLRAAREECLRALELDPKNADAHAQLALAK